jgi:hypothetical protein
MKEIIIWICGSAVTAGLLSGAVISWYILLAGKFKTHMIMPDRKWNKPNKGKVWFMLQSAGLFFGAMIVLMRTTQLVEGHRDNVIENLIYAVSGMLMLRALGEFRVLGLFRTEKEGAFARLDRKWLSPAALILFMMTWPLL